MAFDTLNSHLSVIATKALSHCKSRYGQNGLKIESAIDATIGWKPSFYLKPSKFRLIAVEVEDNLYPEALKGAAHDISHYDFPISVYQACSLDAYQTDPQHKKVNLLRKHGFGIITVDDDGNVTIQHNCIPLAQHISPDHFESQITGLNSSLKVALKAAYETYQTNEGQGLQQAGQIVEGLVMCIADQAVKAGLLPRGTLSKPLAARIDDMYGSNDFSRYRAELGGAREFVNQFRNTASHAPKTAKQAAEKIRNCKAGFTNSINVIKKLRTICQNSGYKVKIYTT